jgi:hypothetical protein
MKKLLALALLAVIGIGIAGQATAGQNPLAQLAIDVRAKTKTTSCATLGTAVPTCSAVVQTGATQPPGTGAVSVTVFAHTFNAMTVTSFGLDWHDSSFLYSAAATNCGDTPFVTVRATDATVIMAWGTCQTSSGGADTKPILVMTAVTGTNPGRIDFKTNDIGELLMVDCNFVSDDIHTTHPGFGQGAVPGPADLAPCVAGPTATDASTWGGVKSLYR